MTPSSTEGKGHTTSEDSAQHEDRNRHGRQKEGKLLSLISLCLIGLVIAALVGTALALMLKKLSE